MTQVTLCSNSSVSQLFLQIGFSMTYLNPKNSNKNNLATQITIYLYHISKVLKMHFHTCSLVCLGVLANALISHESQQKIPLSRRFHLLPTSVKLRY